MERKSNQEAIDSYLMKGGSIQVLKATKRPIKKMIKIWDWKDAIKKIDANQLAQIATTLKLDKSLSINEAFKKVLKARS